MKSEKASLDLLSTSICSSRNFDLTRDCVLTWVTKILMRAILECSGRPHLTRVPQVPHHCL